MPRSVAIALALSSLLVGLTACAVAATSTAKNAYMGRTCLPPKGHKVADCRVGRNGAPDLSRKAFRALHDQEVTITNRLRGLAPNPAAGGARDWPLLDSLGQPMGRVSANENGYMTLTDTAGRTYGVAQANSRGRGCAADPQQDRSHFLMQIVALKARASGTQAFVDQAALDRTTPSGKAAFDALVGQRGGGTGCGPALKERNAVRQLRSPNVGKAAHARLGDGTLNTVTEYDAKPEFGNVLYFSSNTTDVSAGGIARGMVKVGTPVVTLDAFPYCDPNSDGTLLWRYVAIRTGATAAGHRKRMYGWIPARCPARLKDVAPPR
ncbi:hypothetical protein DSM112329_03606 [Paraconexibacter sp. AEG42_29]|uniref:Lipoprotein n=1 Tax=Paraconexibacter sp. AEG42_29 TaxID=2997339 RepID=A0AAU7AYE1_9ACTN